jgi:hypothetical protein
MLHADADPFPVNPDNIDLAPFAYNGRIYVFSQAYGSASLVEDGVITTAAHVVFDETTMNWAPNGLVRFFPRYNGPNSTTGNNSYSVPAGFHRWTQYYPLGVAEDEDPLYSSMDTFNADFAVGYFSSNNRAEILKTFAEVHVDPIGEESVIRDDRLSTLVGYPTVDPIPSEDLGKMHTNDQDNRGGSWAGLYAFSEESRYILEDETVVGTLPFGLYLIGDLATYAGGSGGALYIQDDLGSWEMSGVLVGGGTSSDFSIVRAIDEEAFKFIESAVEERGVSTRFRVEDLTVQDAHEDSVSITWSDLSSGENAYRILRKRSGSYEQWASVAADSVSYTDTMDILPGHAYKYQVQATFTDGSLPPKSNTLEVVTPGAHESAQQALMQPNLLLSSSGDNNWYVDDQERLRSGVIKTNSYSSIHLRIIGPGTVQFDWSASSELNPEYNVPPSPYYKEIYDAIRLLLNGEAVMEENEPVFLSGDIPVTSRQLTIPEGSHDIEWRYQKDPFTDEFEDAGFLHSLTWVPDPANPHPVWGAFEYDDPDWNGSMWFGDSYIPLGEWIYNQNLGWLYVYGGTSDGGLYAWSLFEQLGRIYTSVDLFPWFYLIDEEAWSYYMPDSGNFGSRAAIWNFDGDVGANGFYLP